MDYQAIPTVETETVSLKGGKASGGIGRTESRNSEEVKKKKGLTNKNKKTNLIWLEILVG